MNHSKTQCSTAVVSRPLAEFSPNIWSNPLLCFPVGNQSDYEAQRKRNGVLRERVRGMLMCSEKDNAIENIQLIDTLCRLGVSYHFRGEIEDWLKEIYDIHLKDITKDLKECDLNTVAVVFHTLRSHGFMMPSDVFERFKREDGKFDETIATNTRGMLSLYEATQWGVRGEEILDEVIAFVTPRLEFMATRSSSQLAKHIMDVLEWPYQKDMPRIQERRFISFYQEEEKEKVTKNHTLLEFAKLDYNLLQQLYRQELNSVSRWYQDLNLSSKLPYGRDRIVEAYFWAAGTYFEPQYSHARILLAKVLVFGSFVNDTYDAYGTFEELSSLTNAIDRWKISEDLPGYMKILCRAIFNFYTELETELGQPNKSQAFLYAKDAFKNLAKAYFQKAKWLHQDHIPTFEEFIKTGIASCGYHSSLSTAAIGMGEAVDLEALQWLIPRPKLLETLEAITRIINDLASHKFEQQRPHCASAVECYMKQHGVSEEEAIKKLQELVKQKRKEFNEEFMRPNQHVPRPLIQSLLDLLRTTDVIYKYGDSYTHPELMNGLIKKLLVDDIPI